MKNGNEKKQSVRLWLPLCLFLGAFAAVPAVQAEKVEKMDRVDKTSNWLPLSEVARRLETAGYRNIEKIEREDGVYEARATDSNGARVKLDIHPQTGEISTRSKRQANHRHPQQAGAAGATLQAECNRRRCRDDAPVMSAAPVAPR